MLHFAIDITQIHQMESMNFMELDTLLFRNKVVVILKSQKSIKIERSSDASLAFNYNDMFLVE